MLKIILFKGWDFAKLAPGLAWRRKAVFIPLAVVSIPALFLPALIREYQRHKQAAARATEPKSTDHSPKEDK
ncbi:hypothetical protein EPO05_00065 [Patescibacteria group bacterium]|nr:MAG: hypothetical protein EPO05_00065 [Patescibacteria group bacterium]